MSLVDMVDIDPNRRAPLHRQVSQALVGLVDAGNLAGALPAPAQLARELRFFRGSIRRAYDELVDVGVLNTEDLRYSVSGRRAGS